MAMDNTAPCDDFGRIMADLESDNTLANVAAVHHASVLIAEGKLPDPMVLSRLISGLASNLSKSHHDIAVKKECYSTLNAIRVAITSNHRNMDPSAYRDALDAIQSCMMDTVFCQVQRHGEMVRLWPVQGQLTAVRAICIFLHRSLVNMDDSRCVAAFASLMLSLYTNVVCACADDLFSLPQIVLGFTFTVARAYLSMLMQFPPQSSLHFGNVGFMLDRLKLIGQTMVGHPGYNNLAMDVLWVLAYRNLALQKKVLDLAVSLLTSLNVNSVLKLLRDEVAMAETSDMPVEYLEILDKAIKDCNSAYPKSSLRFLLDPKYPMFVECIHCIKDIMDRNSSLRPQLLKGLLRALRHVRSSPVCAASVWAISACSVSQLEARRAVNDIADRFKDLLDQREIEKQIIGNEEVQHEYTLSSDYYSAKEGDATGQREQPWLMDMEELLFVHMGITRHADGSCSIASSSRRFISVEDEFISAEESLVLERTDNLAWLVRSGDALLADFVDNVLAMLVAKE